MKISGFWVLFLAAGTVVVLFGFSGSKIGSSNPYVTLTNQSGSTTITTTNRKVKDQHHHELKKDSEYMNVEDYRPIDPVPSSKASIRPGPIEHGSPLIPYIPKPSPPGQGHPALSTGGSN
ncbi:hypothetical protein ACFE04_004744 [Oxalis oulophora]